MQGVAEGLASLQAGGIYPRTLIIDDGWQMTEVDEDYAAATTRTHTRGLPRWLNLREDWEALRSLDWDDLRHLGSPRKPADGSAKKLDGGGKKGDNKGGKSPGKDGTGAPSRGNNGTAAVGDNSAAGGNGAAAEGAEITKNRQVFGSVDRGDFEESQQSVLSSFADNLAGGSELMMTMPALSDAGALCISLPVWLCC
jgi:Raffinose synthase or seed imbibition protein Sip1